MMLHNLHNLKIYRVLFEKNSYGLDREYDMFDQMDQNKISNISPMAFIDFNDNKTNSYVLYIIIEEKTISEYTYILEKYDIKYDIKDISIDVLNKTIILEPEIRKHISNSNLGIFTYFISNLDEWIYENLDIDIVLDRISMVGMDGLDQSEKEFLKNYKV